VYLTFLNANLAVQSTTQLEAVGYDLYHRQAHVQWLNGTFVASSLSNSGPIKVGQFAADGTPAGSITVPTENPNGLVWNSPQPDGDFALSGGLFATSYNNVSGFPQVTLLNTNGAEIGNPVALPYPQQFSPMSVAGTSQGFVAVYNGTDSGDGGTNAASVLATLVSPAGGLGATYNFTGGFAFGATSHNVDAIRGAGDGMGAGFAVFYPDGSERFLYVSGDGTKPVNPQPVLQQANPAGDSDEGHLTNFAGSFVLSLYSNAEHLTRVAATGCP
jgi:hypothetical protein